jgi:hypothetical protein
MEIMAEKRHGITKDDIFISYFTYPLTSFKVHKRITSLISF